MSDTLLGVIIGGSIAGICGVITAFSQYCFDKWKRKQEKIDEIEKNNRIKKESIYVQFLTLQSLLFGLQYGYSIGDNKEKYVSDFKATWGDEMQKHGSKAFEYMASLSLFCNTSIANKCNTFTFKYNQIDSNNYQEACSELENIVSLMKEDLGVK